MKPEAAISQAARHRDGRDRDHKATWRNMSASSLVLRPLDHPKKSLVAVSLLWKALILLIALFSPGPGYDTSTTLIQSPPPSNDATNLQWLLHRAATKLTRWDAIYFTTIARRGYVYEQEWAFGWGFTRLIRFFAGDLRRTILHNFEFVESLVGISLSHASHGLSALALYSLVEAIIPKPGNPKLPFIAAALHILSPAGIFLSAPYGESTFALLSFVGYLLFVRSIPSTGRATAGFQDTLLVAAGAILGVACTIRSNGLFNGVLFMEELLRTLLSSRNGISIATVRRLGASGLGGLCIAVGFLLPQYIAFQEYCVTSYAVDDATKRAWCARSMPSIYTYVQAQYWNVGFLRYWTISNIPLFLLATPMLLVLIASSVWAFRFMSAELATPQPTDQTRDSGGELRATVIRTKRLLGSLALPQLLLAVLALTNYHVQIITRIASGSCIWYIWLAASIVSQARGSANRFLPSMLGNIEPLRVVAYLMVYAVVQAGLYSSFLPPA